MKSFYQSKKDLPLNVRLICFALLLSLAYTQNNDTLVIDGSQKLTKVGNNLTALLSPVWLQRSTTELTSFLADKYTYFVTKNGNKVWACAMSLAWNQLKRSFISGQDANFSNTNILQKRIISNLNAGLFTKKQLSQSSYYVTSGFGQRTIDRINLQVKQKFPLRTFQDLKQNLGDEDFVTFAYLYKDFLYKTPFDNSVDFKFKNVVVSAFQAKNSKQKKQLYYKYYKSRDDFLMGIQTKDEKDQVLLFKTPSTQIKNFKIQKVLNLLHLYQSLPNKRLAQIDQFIMPDLDFDYTRIFSQMQGLKFANQGLQKYQISKMFQKLKLKVTNQGVKVENQAVIILLRTSSNHLKYFHLDNDFWFILKQKNKKPYLIISVASVKQYWSN